MSALRKCTDGSVHKRLGSDTVALKLPILGVDWSARLEQAVLYTEAQIVSIIESLWHTLSITIAKYLHILADSAFDIEHILSPCMSYERRDYGYQE